MDVIFRLRVLIWVLILSLWGIMVYQYLGEEEAKTPRMHEITNPYKNLPPAPMPSPQEHGFTGSFDPLALESQPHKGMPPSMAMLRPQSHDTSSVAFPPGMQSSSLQKIRAPDYIKGPASQVGSGRAPPAAARPPPPLRETAVPPGFIKRVTPHFTVYSEVEPASEELLDLLENLHTNLMLDLAAFSPWADENYVFIFLFQNQDSYRRITGRPAWSGGASSVPKRRIYLYKSAEIPGILAHELCHIYYDSFFINGPPEPLWLSEGMATLIQIERGFAAPNWLRENLEILEHGGGYSLKDLMGVTSTGGMGDAKVRLWYAQSYSVVRFLIRMQYRSSFYKFSRHLREGCSVTESLYRGYGMPYNRLQALEYAWRYEITTKQLSRLTAVPR